MSSAPRAQRQCPTGGVRSTAIRLPRHGGTGPIVESEMSPDGRHPLGHEVEHELTTTVASDQQVVESTDDIPSLDPELPMGERPPHAVKVGEVPLGLPDVGECTP